MEHTSTALRGRARSFANGNGPGLPPSQCGWEDQLRRDAQVTFWTVQP